MASDKVDRSTTTPFLLRVFYRTGAFHKSEEFLNPAALPHHLTLYTWSTCTLGELATHLASATSSSILPEPSMGTRLVFKLVYPDAKAIANANAPAAFIIRDMGSVVLGADLPGVVDYDRIMEAEDEEYEYQFNFDDYDNNGNEYGQGSGSNIGAIMDGYRDSTTDDSKMTLADYKFVIGDYISVAILPPEADGSVQDASNARSGRGSGPGEARALPPTRNENGFGGFDGPPQHGGHGGRHGGRRGRGRGGPGFSGINTMPLGEWRRGEQIPEPSRGGRRGRRW